MIGAFWSDIRDALRGFRRSPGFALTAMLTLTLGIGANLAVFTVIKSVLLTPLPYRDPSRLVAVWEDNVVRHHPRNVINPQNYLDWKTRTRSFTGLAMYTWSSMTLLAGGEAERVSGRAITPNLFGVLGVAPALGRTFSEAEGLPNGPHSVILSDGLWRRRFGGDPKIIGRTIATAGGSATVVGVMPSDFRPLGTEQYWEPFQIDPADRTRRGRYAMAIGRLKPGVTAAAAQSDVAAAMASIAQDEPFDVGWTADVIPLRADVAGAADRTLWILMGAVLLVLLIACANVANLSLSRALARVQELAVRSALGASRWRVARQTLAEGILLALAGGVAGLLLAQWAVRLLVSLRPDSLPRVAEIRLDPVVLGAGMLASLLVGVLIALPSVLQRGRGDAAALLHGGTNRTTAGLLPSRVRGALVVSQLALALMLLIGAGLLLQSLRRLTAVDPGFDPHELAVVDVGLPDSDTLRSHQAAVMARLGDVMRAAPGVRSAGLVSTVPLTGRGSATTYRVVGRPEPAAGQSPVADIQTVDPYYFATMRIPVMRGRGFSEADRADARPVIVVSRQLAEEQWPGADPIGQRLLVSWAGADTAREVIGVVGDVHHLGLDADPKATIYYPEAQEPMGYMSLVVRGNITPAAVGATFRRAIHEIDPEVPVGQPATMYSVLAQSVDGRRYPLMLLAVFAGLAVTLAGIGVYGVIAFAVNRRRREIGIRMALGASSRAVMQMLLRGGVVLAGIGLGVGLIGGLLATRVLRALLFEVRPSDPFTLAAASVVVFGVALLAVYLPARRATRVEPVEVLRED